jgi:cell division septal protein FtsQ
MKANKLKKGRKSIPLFSKLNIALLASVVISALCIYFYHHAHHMRPLYPIQKVVFIDNKHLTDEELKEFTGVQVNKSLLTVSCREVSRHMLKSPWIKSANVRREFPGILSITIKETEPFALLDMNEHLFLVDEKGKILEELKDDAVPFLPIIVSDPDKEKDGFSEALHLVRLLNDKGLTSGKGHIEVIAHKPHELRIEMDETVVKIGAGGYDEKLERLIQLEEDLKDRNIPVDYIDLRFGDKAIVKPITARRIEE